MFETLIIRETIGFVKFFYFTPQFPILMKLLEYFKAHGVKNLYVLHKEGIGKGPIYSLTYPLI